MVDLIIYAAVSFLVALNPIGLVPVFLGVTAKQRPQERLRTAARASVLAAGLLLGFMFFGQILFDAIDLHLSAFRVAGGLVLLLTGLRMVIGTTMNSGGSPLGKADIALFPLAMPHIAGPATIMSAILLTDNDTVPLARQIVVAAVLMTAVGVCYLAMRAATPLQRYLGHTGANVITRVMGLILASIAVEHVLAGLRIELALGGH